MGVYGEILYPLSDLYEFGTRVCLKPSNDRGEFEFDLARSKNNIAKNSFALGHKTDNSVASWSKLFADAATLGVR